MRRHTSLILGLIFGTVAALGSASASAQEVREEFHQSFPLAANGSVSLSNLSGRVKINTWERNEVKIDAVKRADTQQHLNDAKIVVENTADRISIRTKYPNRGWDDEDNDHGRNCCNHTASVDYQLTVPAGASLDAVKLVSGDLEIKGVGGEVHASSISGDVRAEGLRGRAEISSVSGNVQVTYAGVTDRLRLNSVSGDLVAVLPANASASVSANTVSGDISNEFGLPVEHGQYVGHHLTGTIGGGQGRIDLHTVSGEIRVKRASM